MGFNHFWHILKGAPEALVEKEIEYSWVNESAEKKPWIVIDWNNFIMNCTASSGGHLAVLEKRLTLFFSTLWRCGARICIIRDNSCHTEERAVLKLQRMHDDLTESVDIQGEKLHIACDDVDSEDVAFTLAFNLATRALHACFVDQVSSNCDDPNPNISCIFCKAEGEADPDIRKFARKKCEQGKRVLILSNDASLVLGVGPSVNLAIARSDSLTLFRKSNEGDKYFIRGKIYPVTFFLQQLQLQTNEILNAHDVRALKLQGPEGKITDDMLPLIAALLGGETAKLREGQYDDPISLVHFMKDFLLHRKDERRESLRNSVVDLLAATALIRAWKKSAQTTSTTPFRNCIMTLVSCANTVDHLNQQSLNFGKRDQYTRATAVPTIYSLQSWANNTSALTITASSLLRKFESRVPRHCIRFREDGTVHANYRNAGVWYSGKVTKNFEDGTFGVSYSASYRIQDGCPGGLSNPHIPDAIAKEFTKRVAAALDQTPLAPINRSVKWGSWTPLEPVEEDTEMLLSPLATLGEQVNFAAKRVSSELYCSASVDVVSRIESISPVGGRGVVAAFNGYLKHLLCYPRVDELSSAPEARKISSASENDDEEDVIIIRTSKVALPLASRPSHNLTIPIVTCELLNDQFVRRHVPLPAAGVIVNKIDSPTNTFGTMFRQCDPEDALHEADAYCRMSTEPLFHSSVVVGMEYAGTLLNLHKRAMLIDHLIRRGLLRPSNLPSISPEVYAAAVLFENLGFSDTVPGLLSDSFRLRIEEACGSIAVCWALLPCTQQNRDYIVGEDSAKGSSRVLFSVAYSYIALHGRQARESLLSSDEGASASGAELVERLCTALLLSPLFVVYALGLQHADGTARTQRVDFCTSVADFSESMKVISGSRIHVVDATRKCDRLVGILEQLLVSVVELMGDIRDAVPSAISRGDAKCVWMKLCRWFDLTAMQNILGLFQTGSSIRRCCEVMYGLLEEEEEEGDSLESFVEAAEAAISAMSTALGALADYAC